jgi:thymidylate synthase (FAD)
MMGQRICLEQITPDAEDLIEKACRTCYLSWSRYNPPHSGAELIQKVIKKRHFSVLEHAVATFRISGASRVLTHELVRHRIASFSQESQRYVCYASTPTRAKTTDYVYVTPPSVMLLSANVERQKAYLDYENLCMAALQVYENLLAAGIPPEDARYVLPNATMSRIVFTANFRELRHFFHVRTNPRAHWEIRGIAIDMLRIMKERAPNVFFDFDISPDGSSAKCLHMEDTSNANGD